MYVIFFFSFVQSFFFLYVIQYYYCHFLIQNKLVLYFFYIYTVTSLSSVLTKNSELCPLFLALFFSRVSPVFVIIWNALNHKWLCLFKNLRRKQKNIQLVNQISLPKKLEIFMNFRLKQPYLLLVLIYFYQNISRIVRVFFRCM